MTSENQTPASGPNGPQLSELADAFFGWNARFGRTLVDSLINPSAVARAALASDTTRYAGPLRLFVFLFGLLLAITTLIAGDSMTSVEALTGATPEELGAWLVGSQITLAEINASLGFWMGLAIWPISVLSAAPYIMLFKAYAPKRTVYGHTLVYLMTTNGAMALQILVMLALTPWLDVATNAIVSTALLALVYFYIGGRVVAEVYSATWLGATFKVMGLIALTPIAFILIGVLQIAAVELVVQSVHGLSVLDLMMMTQPGDS
jgi:hypothetical protein